MAKQTPIDKLNYEQAFEELKKVVADLEDEQHSLDDALVLFERGQALAQRCAELLNKAELKVQELTADGELKDFEE